MGADSHSKSPENARLFQMTITSGALGGRREAEPGPATMAKPGNRSWLQSTDNDINRDDCRFVVKPLNISRARIRGRRSRLCRIREREPLS
jgi:hypothetical protein